VLFLWLLAVVSENACWYMRENWVFRRGCSLGRVVPLDIELRMSRTSRLSVTDGLAHMRFELLLAANSGCAYVALGLLKGK